MMFFVILLMVPEIAITNEVTECFRKQRNVNVTNVFPYSRTNATFEVFRNTTEMFINGNLNKSCKDLGFYHNSLGFLPVQVVGACPSNRTSFGVVIPSIAASEKVIITFFHGCNNSLLYPELNHLIFTENFYSFSSMGCNDPSNTWEDATEIQDGSFLKFSSTFTDYIVDAENQETHSHYLSAVVSQSTNTTYFQCTTVGGTEKVRIYDHTQSGYLFPYLSHSPTNPLPPHKGFNMCKGNKWFIKKGFIVAVNDTSNLPPGFRIMNDMEGRLPMKHSTLSEFGGSKWHYHTYYADTKTSGSPFQTCLVGIEDMVVAIFDHRHHVSGKTSNSSNIPSNIQLVLLEAETEDAELEGGYIVFASGVPPIGLFEAVTDPKVLNKFLMGGNLSTLYNSFTSSHHYHNTLPWDLPKALPSNSSYLTKVQEGGTSTNLNYGDHPHDVDSIICMNGLSPDNLKRTEMIPLRKLSNKELGMEVSSFWDWPEGYVPTNNNGGGEVENGPDEDDEPGWLGIPFSTWIPIGAGSATGIVFLVLLLSCIVIFYLILAVCFFLCFSCIIGSGGGGGGCFCGSCLYKYMKDRKDGDAIELELETIDDRSSIVNRTISWKDFIIPNEKIKLLVEAGKGGSNSVVFKAEYDSKVVALKKFRRFMNDIQSFEEFLCESNALLRTSHPFICRWLGIVTDKENLGIVMEYGENGDIESYITKNKVKLEQKIYWLYEVALAMRYLHEMKIVHRDIKPKNILLNFRLEALVCDFGLSKQIEDENTRGVGTSFYCAPEVKKSEYGLACDIYSYAYMIYTVCCEEFNNPFGGEKFQFYGSKFETQRPSLIPLDKVLGNKFKWIRKIVTDGWKFDPEVRQSFNEIVEEFENNGIKRDISSKLKEKEEEDDDDNNITKKDEEVRVQVSNIEEHIE